MTLRLVAYKRGETAASCGLEVALKEEEADAGTPGPASTTVWTEGEELIRPSVHRSADGFIPAKDSDVEDGEEDADEDRVTPELIVDEVTTAAPRPRFEGFWCASTQLCIWNESRCDGFNSCLDDSFFTIRMI